VPSKGKSKELSNSQNPTTLNVTSAAFSKGGSPEGAEGMSQVKRIFAAEGTEGEAAESTSRSPRPNSASKGITVTAPSFKPTLDATSASPKQGDVPNVF